MTQKDHLLFNIFESICVSYTYLYVALRPLPIKPLEMGEVRQVEAQGPVPTFKLGVSLASGEILWPGWPYFNIVYGDTQRALLKVVDKSEKSIRTLYSEIIGADPPPKLAVSFQIIICFLEYGIDFQDF